LIKNFEYKIKKYERGITLIELVVVIFIITLFSSILIADFPRIQRGFALSRATYQFAQDLRKTQDLGLSGVQTTDSQGDSIAVKGYGVYIDLTQSVAQYLIYADMDGDGKYTSNLIYSNNYCNSKIYPRSDCIISLIDISNANLGGNPNLYIKVFKNITMRNTSINFSPPNPDININNRCISCSDNSEVGIVFGLLNDNSSERTVCINTSGLISIHTHNCSD